MVAILGALLVVGTVAFVILLFVGMSGGVRGVIANMQSAPTAKELAAPKAAMSKALTRDLEEAIDPNAPFQFSDEATDDLCSQGQNNWKIQDGYAYKCDLKITRFYGFSNDLRGSLLALDLALHSEGFLPVGSETMAETTDRIAFGTPSTDLLYPPCYQKGKSTLCLKLADRNTQDFSSLDSSQRLGYGPSTEHPGLVNAAGAARQILQNHQYVLALSAKGTYFQK